MTRALAAMVFAGLLRAATAAAQEPPADPPLVQGVAIVQNQFLPSETLLYYVSTKAGDQYDELRLREDFRRLWDTGFLDDLLVDVRDGSNGKIVSFVVRERRRVQIVDYRGSKEVTSSNIEDKLKEKEEQIKIDTFYDPAKARKVEGIIREMLNEKGLRFASVRRDPKNLGGAGVQVSFVIDDGPKTKVKEIRFAGNEVFGEAKLRGRMKKIKEAGFWNWSWLGGKNTYTEEKWGQDQESLRDLYLDNGYVTATVGQPALAYSDGRSGFLKKKPVKWLTLTIPLTEGDQYRVGEMTFEGLTVFKEAGLRPLFRQGPGDVYDDSHFKKAYEKLRDLYGSQGYFQWTGFTRRTPDPARKVVDVVVSMEEDKRYYIGRIRFAGNETTRDKVIRREIYMNEGDAFNTEALKLSIKRVNQLGYFKPMEGAPEIQPSALGDDKLDVTFKVQEQNRNQFTFGGGVSGIDGAFVNASFSTSNFLGLGETVALNAQTGQRGRNYSLTVSEPYFLDRPITAGVDLFARRTTYYTSPNFVGFSQQSQGISLTSGIPGGRFTRLYASYGYQIVDIYDLDQAQLQRLGLANAAYLKADRTYESRVTPSWVRNTVDNPFTPRAGTRQTATLQLVGGPLGGSVSYYSPTLEAVLYHPVTRKTALGLRAQGAYATPFGSTKDLPYYQRFFLGGENQIRGYDVRTVSPIDPVTKAATGGNKFVLFNAEYYYDIFGPLRLLLFFDAGEAYLTGQSVDFDTLSTSTGVEARFVMPVLNVPFRLIYAWNPNRASFQPATAFKFAVGTTF